MADFAKIAFDLVNKTFTKEARDAILARPGEQVVNVSTGEITTPQTTHKIKAVFTEYSMRMRQLEGIELGDRKCLLPAQGLKITPQNNDLITLAGEVWRVVSCEIDPTGSALHTLQLRRVQ